MKDKHTDANRLGDWIATYTGTRFYLLDPQHDDIQIEDIAHGLAHTCRFSGQCRSFYSVAQHSVLMSTMVEDNRSKLYCLLHDGAEAYVGDLTKPLKNCLPRYQEIEWRIQRMVYTRFGLHNETPTDIKDLDTRFLHAEARDMMHGIDDWWDPELAEGIQIDMEWPPTVAEVRFLSAFEQAGGVR